MDSLIDQWVALAVRHARVRRVDDLYVADVAGLAGPWADGDTLGGAIASLTEVLADWVVLKLERGDTNIPPMEGVKLVLDDEPS
ncbi:MAG: type II toxin-antitoxin system HicB family antitoxin [Acidimicrobiales bacterium]